MVSIHDIKIGPVIGKGSYNRGRWDGKDVAVKTIKIPPGYDAENVTNYREIVALRSPFCVYNYTS